jgi:hypothetical protein
LGCAPSVIIRSCSHCFLFFSMSSRNLEVSGERASLASFVIVSEYCVHVVVYVLQLLVCYTSAFFHPIIGKRRSAQPVMTHWSKNREQDT